MNNPISDTYSDERLRTIVEEYITTQKRSSLSKTFALMSFIGRRRRGRLPILAFTRATSLLLPIVRE